MLKENFTNVNILRTLNSFILDMDGTIYSGDQLFDGTLDLLKFFESKNFHYYFLTNNSSKTAEIYLAKLHRLGISMVTREKIITSGDIAIDYLNQFQYRKIYLVGTPELENQFRDAGIILVKGKGHDIDCVVVGFDTTFNYIKGDTASWYIRRGVPFISTNEDLVCPVENHEFIPDCGAVSAFIEKASGVKPKFIGKPTKVAIDYLLDHTHAKKESMAIIGDRLYTDIASGYYNDFCSIAVLSGEFKMTDLESSDVRPKLIFSNVRELVKMLESL